MYFDVMAGTSLVIVSTGCLATGPGKKILQSSHRYKIFILHFRSLCGLNKYGMLTIGRQRCWWAVFVIFLVFPVFVLSYARRESIRFTQHIRAVSLLSVPSHPLCLVSKQTARTFDVKNTFPMKTFGESGLFPG